MELIQRKTVGNAANNYDVILYILKLLEFETLKEVRRVSHIWNDVVLTLLHRRSTFNGPSDESLIPSCETRLFSSVTVSNSRLRFENVWNHSFSICRLSVKGFLEAEIVAKAINDGDLVNLRELAMNLWTAPAPVNTRAAMEWNNFVLPRPEQGPNSLIKEGSLPLLQKLRLSSSHDSENVVFPHIATFFQTLIEAAPNITTLFVGDLYDLYKLEKLSHLSLMHVPSKHIPCRTISAGLFNMLRSVAKSLKILELNTTVHEGSLPIFNSLESLVGMPWKPLYCCRDNYVTEVARAFPNVQRISNLVNIDNLKLHRLLLDRQESLRILTLKCSEHFLFTHFAQMCSMLRSNTPNLEKLYVNVEGRDLEKISVETWTFFVNLDFPKKLILNVMVMGKSRTNVNKLRNLPKVEVRLPEKGEDGMLVIQGGISDLVLEKENLQFFSSLPNTLNEILKRWKFVRMENISIKQELILSFMEAFREHGFNLQVYYNHGAEPNGLMSFSINLQRN